jgi:uncharacterized protein
MKVAILDDYMNDLRIPQSLARLLSSTLILACASTPAPVPPAPGRAASAAPGRVPMAEAECERRWQDAHSGNAAEPRVAYDRYAVACNEGCGLACWNAGSLFQRPPRLGRDDAKALAYYRRACELGSGIGCAAVAFSYRMGWGLEHDYEEAKRYYRIGCELAFGPSCGGLGDMFETQLEGPADSTEAARDYLRACELHDGAGCAAAAELYEKGRGVGRDEQRACALYLEGCHRGSASGCAELARILEAKNALSGNERAENLGNAAELYRHAVEVNRKACDNGDPQACSELGDAYRGGKGVARDLEEARRLYRIGCEGEMGLGCDGLRALGETNVPR